MGRSQRIGVLVAVAAAIVVAFVVASPGGDDDDGPSGQPAAVQGDTTTTTTATPKPAPPRPKTAVVRVRAGKPVGGPRRIEVKKGGQIRFSVTSDVADEVHVHGYDVSKDVTAGGRVRFGFKATIDGVFEVELEHRGVEIARLVVEP